MKLAEVMVEKGMTTVALAKATGISKQTLDAYRAGRREPSFKVGLTIADALDVDPHELLDD